MWTFYRENETYSELDHVVNGTKKGGTNYKKGTKCGPFTEKMRPTQEVQHLIRSF